MEGYIRLIHGNEDIGSFERLNKLKAEQKILELFETQKIESVEIKYKKREPACCEASSEEKVVE